MANKIILTFFSRMFFYRGFFNGNFRGLFFGSLYRRSKVLAYCLSVFVFALIHVLNYFGVYPVDLLCLCLLQYIPAGIFLAWAYEKSDSILCPILMHIVINAIGIFSMR